MTDHVPVSSTPYQVYAKISGPIVMIGFGSIGRGTLPLIERHFEYDKERFVVIDPQDDDIALLNERGIRFVQTHVTKDNYRELLTPLGSHKLLPLFEKRRTDLIGILNGCNYQDWNPTNDPLLPVRYSASDLTGKGICKSHLQHYFGLQEAPDIPLFGMVSRLTEQKGFHLLLPALEQFLRQRVQVVIIGAGDPALAAELTDLASRFPDQLKFMEGHTSRIAHWVVAGSDFFLMPSLFEPCGLTQMYALAYGSLPLVRAVGGLRDTIVPHRTDSPTIAANGLSFDQPSPAALLEALHLAQRLFCHDGTRYRVMQQQAMATRFHWSDAAMAYLKLYRAILEYQFL